MGAPQRWTMRTKERPSLRPAVLFYCALRIQGNRSSIAFASLTYSQPSALMCVGIAPSFSIAASSSSSLRFSRCKLRGRGGQFTHTPEERPALLSACNGAVDSSSIVRLYRRSDEASIIVVDEPILTPAGELNDIANVSQSR